MPHAYVLGYGSLIDPGSAAETLGRRLPETAMPTAVLPGWQLAWNVGAAPTQRRHLHLDGTTFDGVVCYLGIRPHPDTVVYGRLLPVTDTDLARLDTREANYDRADLTDLVHADADLDPAAPVYAYLPQLTARARLLTAAATGNAARRRAYVDLTARAVASLGADAASTYRDAPTPPGLQTLDLLRLAS